MSTEVKVVPSALRDEAQTLKRTHAGHRPSAAESGAFGSPVAVGAVHRFEAYWVAGQVAVDDLVAGLSGALEQVAGAYERRDAEDSVRFHVEGSNLYGF